METPKTLLQAVRYFSSLDACHALMVAIKWPDGQITCPKCGGDKVGNIASRRLTWRELCAVDGAGFMGLT